MLSNIVIKNLKGIKECNIEDLGLINFFIGKNNSCKSTILEALFYGLNEFSNKPILIEMLRHRTDAYSGGRELWFNYETGNPIVVDFDFAQSALRLQIEFKESTNQITSNLGIRDKKASRVDKTPGTSYASDLNTASMVTLRTFNIENFLQVAIRHYIYHIQFLENSQRNVVSSAEDTLAIIKTSGLAGEFGSLLQSIYGIGEKWEFLPSLDNLEEFRSATIINDLPYFLSGLGDGFRYTVPIVEALIMNKNTALLIEEIESNQHPVVLKKLLIEACKRSVKNNLQLFVTTHSEDVGEILYFDVFDDSKLRDKYFHYYFVDRQNDGTVKCERIKPEENEEDWRKVHHALFST